MIFYNSEAIREEMNNDVISGLKASITHRCVTRRERVICPIVNFEINLFYSLFSIKYKYKLYYFKSILLLLYFKSPILLIYKFYDTF